MSARDARLHLDAHDVTGLSFRHAGVGLVRRLELANPTDGDWVDVIVRVEAEPPFAEPWSARLDALAAGRVHDLGSVPLSLSPTYLAVQEERVAGRLVVTVTATAADGASGGSADPRETVARIVHEVDLLPPAHWPGAGVLPELLAAWVRPNAAALQPVLRRAADRLEARAGDRGLSGYQRGDPQHAWAMAQAVWEAVQSLGVDYVQPPASFEAHGQKIRAPEDVVEGRLGTCLDLSVVLAALWEQVGLHPFLVVLRGHAFAGVWLTPFQLHEPVHDDPAMLRKRIALGEALVVDSSPVTGPTPFDAARRAAERLLEDDDAFRLVVDVRAARGWGVHPLGPVGAPVASPVSSGAEPAAPPAEAGVPERFQPIPTPAPSEGVADRLERWKRRLLDLTLRNRLLNFRPTKRTVSLPFGDLVAVADALAGGGSLAITARPDPRRLAVGSGEGPEADARARRDRLEALAGEAWARGVLMADHPEAELADALLELHRGSAATYQDTGAVTLYVAVGTLRYTLPDPKRGRDAERTVQAPIVLVPVELVRPSTGGPWRIRPAEDDPRVNTTLLQKLREEHGLDADGLVQAASAGGADGGELEVGAVLRGLRALVVDRRGWEVVDEAWLATFQFTKFLLWLDLEAKREALLAHPVVARIFDGGRGLPVPSEPAPALDRSPSARPIAHTATVLDADPSQLRALLAVRDGADLVLQGPPGTGKSQTITNLVAALVAEGRSVLFVSEKLAALRVVQRRLDAVGLGPFLLELHAEHGSKRAVVEQIKEAFAHAGARPPEAWRARLEALRDVRDALDAHAARLAAPSPFGCCVRDVLARLFGLTHVPRVRLPEVDPATLTPDAVEARRRAVGRLAVALPDAGDPATHPFRGVRHAAWSPAWASTAQVLLADAAAAAEGLERAAAEARVALGLPEGPPSPEGLRGLRRAVALVLDGPGAPSALLEGRVRDTVATLHGWAEEGRAIAARRAALGEAWAPGLLGLDLEALHARAARWAEGFVVFAWFALWGVRRALRPHALAGLPGRAALPAHLDAARAVRDDAVRVDTWADRGRAWLGRTWDGLDTDWEAVAALAEWAATAHRLILHVGGDGGSASRLRALLTDEADRVAPGTPLRGVLRAFQAADVAWDVARRGLVDHLDLDPIEAWSETPRLDAVAAWCRRGAESPDRLRAWCAAAGALAEARGLGLAPAIDPVVDGAAPLEGLDDRVERALLESWWEHHLEEEPALARFRGTEHGARVARFRSLEAEVLALTREEVRARVAARVPDLHAPGDEMALLRRQLQLKTRHMPIRRLFRETAAVLQRVKPCALMSPLSVARFLDPELEGFDVVVFDEASQIPPWDAVGAIARGRQVVVVGDSQQLPPTTFFSHEGSDDEVLDDEDLEELESILDESVASGLPELQLRWHYRSRHESLIAFSNHHYYGNRLHTFPSADHDAVDRGVSWVHVADGHYDRGGSRTNRAEAGAVVERLFGLLRIRDADGRPPTVGVVTFSTPQQRLVQDLVDARLVDHPHLARWFDPAQPEPVFVKNLENVQGDERDVMLFSVGYGPDGNGRVSMNFGPLNRKGGERRLNVAITRARERLVVFSTLRHDQIDLARTQATGVHHLKAFLRYAAEGPGSLLGTLQVADALDFESPFEEEVHAVLERAGYAVHTQVGCSGYRIDLAVVDPDAPGAYVLAVECDGATYHGTPSARARDRIRDAVLGQLGWRVHRVWSTDWWYERDAAEARLLAAVEAARRDAAADRAAALAAAEAARRLATPPPEAGGAAGEGRPEGAPSDPPPLPADGPLASAPALSPGTAGPPRRDLPPPAPREHAPSPLAPTAPRDVDALLAEGPPGPIASGLAPWPGLPAVTGGARDAFHGEAATAALARDLTVVVEAIGPVPAEVAHRHVADAWGWASLGRRIVARCDAALEALPTGVRPRVTTDPDPTVGELLWPPTADPDRWRAFRPAAEGGPSRDAREIPTVEVAAAAAWIVDRGVSMSREAAVRETAAALGFGRLGRRVRARVEAGVGVALERGWVIAAGDRLRAAEGPRHGRDGGAAPR